MDRYRCKTRYINKNKTWKQRDDYSQRQEDINTERGRDRETEKIERQGETLRHKDIEIKIKVEIHMQGGRERQRET